MRIAIPLSLVLLAGLCACEQKSTGLFADRSIPMIAPPASAQTPPRFVGNWAPNAKGCGQPWVVEARSLREGGVNCEFDKVETSSAGYVVTSLCRMPGGAHPGRLSIVMNDPVHPMLMTVSGGPFRDPVALQRCVAKP